MPNEEYSEWMRYAAEEPIGQTQVMDLVGANICMAHFAAMGGDTKLGDWMLFKPPAPPPTGEEFALLMQSKGYYSPRKNK